MARSFVQYTSAGEPTYAVPFPYISQDHVSVAIDGVDDPTFTWPGGAFVQPTVPPSPGSVVEVRRTTPTTPVIDYNDGSVLIVMR